MGGKSSEVESTQTSEPPEWARPLLEMGAADAMKLYQSGKGFGVYTGPTMAPLSAQTLGAMNSIMDLTGAGKDATRKLTNGRINQLVPDINKNDMRQREPVPTGQAARSDDEPSGYRWDMSGALQPLW